MPSQLYPEFVISPTFKVDVLFFGSLGLFIILKEAPLKEVKFKGWVLLLAIGVLIIKLVCYDFQYVIIVNKFFEYICSVVFIIVAISIPYNFDKFVFFKRLGDLSFSFYLFHFFGLYAVVYLNNGKFDSNVLIICFIIINLIIAQIVTNFDRLISVKLKFLIDK